MNALDAKLRPARDGTQQAVLAGLIGHGIGASRTPYMHEAEGTRLGLPYSYHRIDLAELPAGTQLADLLDKAEAEGYRGLNITHPVKQAVIPLLHELSPEAAAIGAVNTVVFEAGRRHGYNTDCWGFAESFRRGLTEARREYVVLLGAGGAGLAVARALLDLGASQVAVFDTDPARAAALAERFGSKQIVPVSDAEMALHRADGVVNATPIGMASYPGSPIPLGWLKPRHWVADIIYFPAETALLQAARGLGCTVLPGAGMAIFQAVKAFELFSGIAPDAEAMTRHFLAAGKVQGSR
ncbi:shikimate dehydrogenase [Ferrovibrio sp.]|uniref:shikimate dehydrogenase n=1 Tax=Ferrovibrio sp. TaxID=1917215 RepID=UPI003D2BC300